MKQRPLLALQIEAFLMDALTFAALIFSAALTIALLFNGNIIGGGIAASLGGCVFAMALRYWGER